MTSQLAPIFKKLILVIGATGAQGLAVIDKLLAPSEDGSPSPYIVRALTRDPGSGRARELTSKGVECVKGQDLASRPWHYGQLMSANPPTTGSFDDFSTVSVALQGVYGAWVNTDGFTVGEQKELYAGMRIFELAKQAGVKHYIWSNLDYALKVCQL